MAIDPGQQPFISRDLEELNEMRDSLLKASGQAERSHEAKAVLSLRFLLFNLLNIKCMKESNLFYEKPQERTIKENANIEYIKNGLKISDKKILSIPCERCNGCPVYIEDESVNPTIYYCHAAFLIHIFNKALDEGTIPQNCKIAEVRVGTGEWLRYL